MTDNNKDASLRSIAEQFNGLPMDSLIGGSETTPPTEESLPDPDDVKLAEIAGKEAGHKNRPTTPERP